MTSVSADGPNPILLVCLHRDGSLGDEILDTGRFCLNILAEDQLGVSEVFAGRFGHEQSDRFKEADGGPWKTERPD